MPRIKQIASALLLSVAALSPGVARADATCTFTVSGVALDTWGNVIVNLVNSAGTYNWYLCATQATVTVNNNYGSGALTSTSCAAVYSQMLTARNTGNLIGMGFHGSGSQPIASCTPADLPDQHTWLDPYPLYISY